MESNLFQKIFYIGFISIICFLEFWYQDQLHQNPNLLFFDCVATFYRPFKFYYSFINDRINVGGLLDNIHWLHNAMASAAVYKLYGTKQSDSILYFCIAYVVPPFVYLVFYIIEVYVLKRF